VSQPFTIQPVELNQDLGQFGSCASATTSWLTGPLFLGPVLLFELG